MPERTLTYIYESEDRSSQALRSMAGSAAGADTAFESLEQQILSYDQSTRSVSAGATGFENALEALNAEGIVTTQQIQNQIAQYDRLLQFFERDALATQQLTSIKAGLQAQLGAATRGPTLSARQLVKPPRLSTTSVLRSTMRNKQPLGSTSSYARLRTTSGS